MLTIKHTLTTGKDVILTITKQPDGLININADKDITHEEADEITKHETIQDIINNYL